MTQEAQEAIIHNNALRSILADMVVGKPLQDRTIAEIKELVGTIWDIGYMAGIKNTGPDAEDQ